MTLKAAPWVGKAEPLTRTALSVAYWETGASCAALSTQYGYPANQINQHAGPGKMVGLLCRACGGDIVENNRTKVGDRAKELSRTYGWSRAKHEAMACNDCQEKEREEARIERFRKRTDAHYGSERASEERFRRADELSAMPYSEYLLTPEWQERRRRALSRAGYACQVCYSSEALHVHHRTYANRGVEMDADLTVLCADCHRLFHERMQLAEKRAEAPKRTSRREVA